MRNPSATGGGSGRSPAKRAKTDAANDSGGRGCGSIAERRLEIDQAVVGRLIGRGGRHINSIRQSTGATIDVGYATDGPSPGMATVVGLNVSEQQLVRIRVRGPSQEQVEQAVRAIETCIVQAQSKCDGDGEAFPAHIPARPLC